MLRSTPPAAMVRPATSWLVAANSTPSYSRTSDAIAAYGSEAYEPYGEEGRGPTETASPSVQDNGSWSNASDYEDLYSIPSDLWMRYSPSIVAVFCLAYTVVFIIGLLGNSFVVAVVARSPRMRTVTNYFIVNLAMADILVVVFCIPATLVGNIFVREYGRVRGDARSSRRIWRRSERLRPKQAVRTLGRRDRKQVNGCEKAALTRN
ncbi:hypothetical protein V5799_026538 [Amblyomma americanum]|uniref:G-protein coupled receptors family 1 profile domain-containing protein n=1 Tax=Amblyomma americanum TaxID=6943 RepID=A0AAQ4DIA5_AMBAM